MSQHHAQHDEPAVDEAVECRAGDILRDEVIGKGASAEVYKVVMANGQTVAVKRCGLQQPQMWFHAVAFSFKVATSRDPSCGSHFACH